jgi:hypothetical protein
VKTALDSSVLLDVLGADQTFGDRSRDALKSAYEAGALVACEVVWAEVRAHFPTDDTFSAALDLLGVEFDPISAETAAAAGRAWQESRRKAPPSRERVVADFLIGAHAHMQADALLSRDRGFYRKYFAGLKLIDPAVR